MLKSLEITEKQFNTQLHVRILAGYFSGIIGISGGAFGQRYLDPPAIFFFCLAFAFGFLSRYLIAGLLGLLYACTDRLLFNCRKCETKRCCSVWIFFVLIFLAVAILFVTIKRFDNLSLRPYL